MRFKCTKLSSVRKKYKPPDSDAKSFGHSFEAAMLLRFEILHFFNSIMKQLKD